MRLHRFYIDKPISEEMFDITDRDLVHQWRNVFRYNVGSQAVLFDGSGTDYLCIIRSLRNLGATVSVINKIENKNVPKINLWLCLGIIKKDNFELVIQKVTELGVSHIVPVLCDRSEKKNINMERLKKITIEASEQSGRGDIPEIHQVADFSEILEQKILPREKIALHLNSRYIGDFLSDKNLKEWAVFIGPEGGWSDDELKDFALHNIPQVSLGPQILRSETAAIAVTSLLLL
ncbi:MAG: 16S rRNA (uracil(1498)-N(3))-methyltransferase [Candidatus Zambryskibacteria bacterium]|nr:16S rRNA (uracil(1498)-N(3))-methyltransferase [Candidatus Zambryskibacteria bacterium]